MWSEILNNVVGSICCEAGLSVIVLKGVQNPRLTRWPIMLKVLLLQNTFTGTDIVKLVGMSCGSKLTFSRILINTYVSYMRLGYFLQLKVQQCSSAR